MPTDTKLQNLIINDLTEEQYKALTPNENELYLTPSIEALYRHNITITGSNADNTIQVISYLTEVSTNNLEVNTHEKFITLFGEQTLSCTGVLRNGNTKDTIINSAVLPTGNRGFTMLDTSASTKMVKTISLTTFTTITFEDTVTTI